MTTGLHTPEPVRIEDIARHPHFRRLGSVCGVLHDLRYVGSNNFAGRSLYGTLDCAWLRAEAAAGLEAAALWLSAQRPGWRRQRARRRAPLAARRQHAPGGLEEGGAQR